MPEGCEAKCMADCLRKKLLNKNLIGYEISGLLKVTGFETLKLPAIITDITSYGKKVIIHIDNKYVVISAGMSGKFIYEQRKHNHVTFIFDDITMYYNNIRRIASSVIVSESIPALGPCLLTAALDKWITRKKWKSLFFRGQRMICEVLLDQTIIAGIGNYLRADILYLAGVNPFKKMNVITDNELELIRIASHEVVLASYRKGGCTILNYVDPDGNKGKYNPIVYGRDIDINGFKVSSCNVAGRVIHYVKEAQG